jgi:hypothetical protein
MPVLRLHGVQESDTVSPDHAELCHQEMPEKAEANGACQVLHGMIRDSACPPKKGSVRALICRSGLVWSGCRHLPYKASPALSVA